MELAKAYVQIVPSAKGINGSITQAISGESISAGRSAGSHIAAGIKTAIAAAGIGTVIKNAVSEGAALEQSIGGIETLFGAGGQSIQEYAKTVGKSVTEVSNEYTRLMTAQENMFKYADEAYKTAGLSANEYMETATSFAASLISSLGGDTKAAAEIGNMAIIDMSDNANKMGSSMESIQNAYQGFAKQNYTMLDNLKLGYGGTKKEMERLLKDAKEISGIEYNIDSLSDVYNAIHVIQEKLHITGTTAKEAEQTLTGSFASMRSAAKNLLGNIALGEDIGPSLKALFETTKTFLVGNLLPMLGNIFKSVPELFAGAFNKLPQLWTSIASQLMPLIQQFATHLPEIISGIIQNLANNITTVTTTIGPQLFQAAISLVHNLSQGVADNIPVLLEQVLPMILQFTEMIRTNAPALIEEGINFIIEIVNGLINGLPQLIEYVPQIITSICDVINENMPRILAAAIAIIITIAKGLIDNLPVILANMGNILNAIISAIGSINWLQIGGNLIKSVANGIKSLASHPVEMIKDCITKIVDTFKNFSWSDLGSDIIDGIKNGIANGIGKIADAAKSAASAALNAAKNFLGIHSPSRLFRDGVGKMIDLGFAEGLVNNTEPIEKAMADISKMTTEPLESEIFANAKVTPAAISNKDSYVERCIELLEELIVCVRNGSVTVPVYIGNEHFGTAVSKAINRINYRSGGR